RGDVPAETRRRGRVRQLVQLNLSIRAERRAVGVEIAPRTYVGLAHRHFRVRIVCPAAGGQADAIDVSSEAGLDRRLAVAEEVVRHTDARVEIFPVQHAAGAALVQVVDAIRAVIERDGL